MNPKKSFIFILVLVLVSLVISLPKNYPVKINLLGKKIDFKISSPEINLKIGKFTFKRDFNIKQGLDIKGGSELVLSADMSQVDPVDYQAAIESTREIISRRIDLYGVVEPVIQSVKVGNEYRLIVDMPGVSDVDSAIRLIGKTAQLEFRELPKDLQNASPSSVPIFSYVNTGLTGKDLKRASVTFNTNQNSVTNEPAVSLEFNEEGRKKFAEITKRNIGKQVAIFIDGVPVTAPTVQEAITQGNAVVSGNFDIDSAKALAIQLNAGALPVPVKVIQQRTIGPSLGSDSVQRSVIAGLIGLLMVIIFMIGYYGWMGVIADVALIIYGLITLAIYKIIPVTLSLPGIAGFILSVGMAVDANILIFERMREELRQGRRWQIAMELGFGRAWDSIKDANFASILTALILLNPLNLQWLVTSGMVRGFALTLLIGVLISMFTGVVVTRTLMRVFYKGKDLKVINKDN